MKSLIQPVKISGRENNKGRGGAGKIQDSGIWEKQTHQKMKLTMATIKQELKDKHLQSYDLEDIQMRFQGYKYCQ